MKKNFAFLFCIMFSFSAFSKTYEDCVKDFQNNKCNDAIAGLLELQKNEDNKNASLLLAIIWADRERYPAAFASFKKFYEKSDNPYPYLYALFNSGIFSNRLGYEVQDFLEEIIVDPKADMAVKQIATDKLASYLIKEEDYDGVRKLYKNTGDIKNWSTVGVFENISGSGFNKDFGPLEYPDNDHIFPDKFGVDVKWFDIVAVRNDRWYDFEYHYNISNSVIYAQTFINSNEDKEVIMKIGVSGSMKVWLNDFLIGSEPIERNTNADVYAYRVKLQKGTNRLLIQLGSSEINKNNFLVRFFDINNNLLQDISSDSHYNSYTKAEPYKVQQLPFFAEKYFEDKLSLDSTDFISNLLLLCIYNKNENNFSAHKILKQLKKTAPYCTYVSKEAITLAGNDKNTIGLSKERESIITNDPENTFGLVLRYQDMVNKEKWDEALALIDQYVAIYGASDNIESDRIKILIKKKDNEKIITEINDAYLKYPDSYDMAWYKYYAILGGSKNLNSANEILIKYVRNDYNINTIEQIIENDFKLGQKQMGLTLFEKALNNNPISVGIYAKYAEALYDMRSYDDAINEVDKAIALAPYIGKFYEIKAEAYEGEGQKAEAISMLKKTIQYSPTDYDARKMLNRLIEKKDLDEHFKENDIASIYIKGRDNKDYDKEEGVCLLNDKREIVYPEHGAVVEQNEYIFLIKSQSAIEHCKEFDIPYNSYTQRLIVDKAEILKKDGNRVAADRENGKCIFSSIEIGDAIHVSYKLEASYEGKLAEQFWESFYFNGPYPVQTSRFSIIVPANRKFNFQTLHAKVIPVKSTFDNCTMYVWESNSIEKMVSEPGMSQDEVQQLVISSVPDWNYIANWYSDLSNEKTTADFEIKEKVNELMNGNEQKSDFEKARIIYNYIENNYHYSSVSFLQSALTPQKASRTLNAKLGDCKDLSVLFVSMAREAGLNANLVLVRTKENGNNDLRVPDIAFNHCIAQLHIDNKDYLIELTSKYLPFSALYSNLIDANGLFIPKDGKTVANAAITKLNTSNRPINTNIRTGELTFENDHGILHRRSIKIGSESANIRNYYSEISQDERLKKLNADISKEFNANIIMDSVRFFNLEKLTDTVIVDYHFTVDNFIRTIAGMKVFKMPWTESYAYANLFSLEKRKYPLEIWYAASSPSNKETITIVIPEGKNLIERPEDVSLSCPAFSYNVKYTVTGNIIVATREFKYLEDEIKPDEYAEVKATVSKIIESDTKEIAFK